VITALAYEGWLDFLVFAWIAAVYLAAMFLHTRRRRELMRGRCGSDDRVGIVYIYIKIHSGYGQVAGSSPTWYSTMGARAHPKMSSRTLLLTFISSSRCSCRHLRVVDIAVTVVPSN
jgi:hypothetical protein